MAVESNDFLKAAISSDASEFGYRTSVSRAYYFLYHYLRGCIGEDIQRFNNTSIHKSLVEQIKLGKHDIPIGYSTQKIIAIKLKRSHHNRIVADYQLDHTVDCEDKNAALETAKYIQSEINRVINNSSS